MARQTINNGDTGLQVRNKLNENFTELYAAGGGGGTQGPAGPAGPAGQSVTITTVSTTAAFNAANPGPLELVVLLDA